MRTQIQHIALALLLMVMPVIVAAQPIVIGTGTSENYYAPFCNYYRNSTSEMIYTADEIDATGTIDTIWFYTAQSQSLSCSELKVYMGHTTASSFNSTSDWVLASDMELVFQAGTITIGGASGWYAIPLQTPFDYNGEDNLVIAVTKKASSYTSSLKWRTTTTSSYRTLYRQNDNTTSYGDLSSLNSSVTGTRTYNRPNIRLALTPANSGSCPRPNNFVAGNITYNGATLTWDGDLNTAGYEICYGTTNDVDLYSDGSQSMTSDSYTLSGLSGATTYYCWVRGLCDDNTVTSWLRTTFTTAPSCAQVLNLQISSITASGAALSWTVDNETGLPQTAVQVKYRTTGSSTWSSVILNNQNYFFLTGLQTGMPYEVQVRSICGTDTSAVTTQTFSTSSCGEVAGGTTSSSYVPMYGLYEYSYAQMIYPGSALAGGDTIRGISFQLASTPSSYPTRTVSISMGNTSLTSLSTSNYVSESSLTHVVSNASMNVSNTGWVTIPFTTPFVYDGSSNIVVTMTNTTGSWSGFSFYHHTPTVGNAVYWYRDGTAISGAAPAGSSGTTTTVPNVRFSMNCGGDCPAPPMIVSAVNVNDITAVWMDDNAVSNWVVGYRATGSDAWSYATTSGSSYTFSPLRQGTSYQLRAGRLCDGDTVFNTITATTLCGMESVPFTESFEAGIGNCWENVSNHWSNSSNNSHSGSRCIYAYADDAPELITSVINCSDLPDGAMLSFWYRLPANSSGVNATLTVSYRTDANGAWTTLTTINTATGDSWMHVSDLALLQSANASYYQLRFSGSTLSDYPTLYLDDITVYEWNECAQPQSLTVSSVSATDASLSWTSANAVDQWQVEIIAGNDTLRETSTTTSYIITDLTPNTDYTVRVFSMCSGNLSFGAAIATFHTLCSIETVPYSETFETGRISACWDTTANWAITNQNYHNGSYALDGSGNYTPEAVMGTFNFSTLDNGALIGFWYRLPALTSGVHANLTLSYRTSANGSWTDIITYDDATNGTAWYQVVDLPLPNSANEPFYQIQLTVSSSGSGYPHAYIDDITVTASNGCFRPESLTLDGVTYESLSLSWEGCPLSTHYEVCYSTGSDNSASDTVMRSSTNSNVTLSGLSSETFYYVWVRGICGSDTSGWSDPLHVTTHEACAAVVNAHISSMSASGVAISWEVDSEVGQTQTAVLFEYKTSTSSQWTSQTLTGQNYYFLTGLNAGTTYNVRITAICGEDTSTTETLNVEMAVCGEASGGTTTSAYIPFYGYYDYSYSQSLYPASVLAGGDTVRGIYWHINSSASQSRTLTVMMGNTAMTSLSTSSYVAASNLTTVVNSTSISFSSTGWKYIPFSTPFIHDGSSNIVVAVDDNTGDYNSTYARFTHHSTTVGNSVYWYQDNSDISPASPSATNSNSTNTVPDIRFAVNCGGDCEPPVVAVNQLGNDAISIAWMPMGNDTFWVIGLKTVSENDWFYDTCSSTSYTFNGLNQGTDYMLRVGVVCGNDTAFTTLNVSTGCGSQEVPFSESFENGLSICWTTTATSGNGWQTTSASGHTGSIAISANASGTPILYTNALDCSALTNNAVLDFWYRIPNTTSNNHATIKVAYRTSATGNWSTIATLNTATIGLAWANVSGLVLPGSAGTAYYQLRITASSNSGSPTAYIDDIVVTESGDCDRASQLTLDFVSHDSAHISWTGCEQATAYEVRYAVGNNVNGSNAVSQTVTTTSASIGNLNASTTYQVWVRSICGEDTTLWSSPIQLTTLQSCASVINAQITDLRSTRATVTWDYNGAEGNPVGSVIVAYRVVGASSWTTDEVSGFSTYFLRGLTAGQTYEMQLSSICGDDTSAAVTLTFTPSVCGEYADGSTTSNYVPTYGFYKYDYSQSIYPGTALNGADTVLGIYWNVSASATQSRTLTIMMGNTTMSYLSTSSYVAPSDMTTVVSSATISFNASGWKYIPFTTPFIYDGTSNIVIAVDDNTGSYNSSYPKFYHHTPTVGNSVYWYQDASDISPASPSATTSNSIATVPDIRFDITCDETATCTAPIALLDVVDTTAIGIRWITPGEETEWVVGYRNDTSNWVYETVSITSHTFAPLDSATHYTLRVGVVCDADTIFSVLDATTLFTQVPIIPECHEPENVMVTMVTDSTISITFSPRDINMAWVVGYRNDTSNWIYETIVDTNHTFAALDSVTHYLLCVGTVCDTDTLFIYIDTTTLAPQPLPVECPIPTGLTVLEATSSTVSVSFDPVGDETQWQVHIMSNEYEGIYTVQRHTQIVLRGLSVNTLYRVRVRAICGDGDTSAWSEAVVTSTPQVGIDNVDDGQMVRIYPNPAGEDATVEIEGVSGWVKVMLVDVSGRVVSDERLDCPSHCAKTFHVAHLPKGTYFVRIVTDNYQSVRKLSVF